MKQLYFLLLLCITSLQAQTITGHVYNAADGMPLEAASVYLDGTTISTYTNADGYFKITTPQQYSAGLVISFMGFETQRIAEPYKSGQPLEVRLVANSINLTEVVISKKVQPFRRQDMMKAFKEQFLGTSDAARSCTILNENDIYLSYDEQRFTMTAEADKPILVRNTRLEYDLSYDLYAFEVKYKRKSIDINDADGCFMAGYTLFRDRSKNGSANKVRSEAYYGSVPHLMKTIRNGSWDKSGINLYKRSFLVKPEEYLEYSDSGTYKKIRVFKDKKRKHDDYHSMFGGGKVPFEFATADRKLRTSFFLMRRDELYIDKNGMVFPLDALVFGGYMGSLKAGDMLPSDYMHYD